MGSYLTQGIIPKVSVTGVRTRLLRDRSLNLPTCNKSSERWGTCHLFHDFSNSVSVFSKNLVHMSGSHAGESYVYCIPCSRVRILQKGCLRYDTKLHLEF